MSLTPDYINAENIARTETTAFVTFMKNLTGFIFESC